MSRQIIEGYQLSPQQKHLWSLDGRGGRSAYAAEGAILVEGRLDGETLRGAARDVVARHEILRTAFALLPDMTVPLQVVRDEGELLAESYDLSGLPEEAQQVRLRALSREATAGQAGRGADAALRLVEVRLAPQRHVLLVSLPALCADAASLNILMRELADCYAARLRGGEPPEAPIQYADLAEWQNESLEAEGSEAGRDYWRRLGPAGPAPRLPFEKDAPEGAEFIPESLPPRVIGRATAEALEVSAARRGSSLRTSLLASFSLLLSRLSSSPALRLGVSFDGRNYDELTSALGLFARILPVEAELRGDLPFPELLAALDASLSEAERWQEFFTHPQAAQGQPGGQPPLPFCFEFVEDGQPRVEVEGSLRFTLTRSWAHVGRCGVLLRCLRREDGALLAEWHYDAARYDEAEVARLAGRWEAALDSLAARACEASLAEVNVVGADERAELLRHARGASEDWGGPGCVHEIFAAQAAANPDNVAVVYEGESLTYGELNARANQLARHLRGRGVASGEAVGLMTGRGAETLVGMLGILKAGGAYVPLEAGQPTERLARMVECAGARVVVGVEGLRAEVEMLRAEVEVYLDGDAEEIRREDAGELERGAGERDAAYVIYTSGSTGAPKGVCVEHRQLTNYVNAVLLRLRLPAGASFALVSTFAADLGHTVVFPALCTGGTLHVISAERATDAGALAEYFSRRPIDCLKIVPSHLSALMTHSRPEMVLPRRCLVLGGEASGWELVERIRNLAPGCRVLNHYGPTEATVGVLTYEVERGAPRYGSQTVPLGRPLANTQVYVLDALSRPTPPGAPGEVCIGGAGLARGYLNSPAAAAEKFIPNPLADRAGERLYRTGDLARLLPDGSVEFLGRTDDQVKVRGFRTEPGEVEAALSRHGGVEQARVIARDTPSGDKRLVAYIVPREDAAATVRRWLRLEGEGRLQRRQGYELPNGMFVASQNRNETDFMYREIFEQKIYLQHGVELADGDCVFDVGANVGMFSLFVSRACAGAKIYAFEPIPPLYELLRANAALYGLDAKVYKCGVAADATRQEFTYYPHLTLMSGRYADLAQDHEVVKLFESNRRGPEAANALDERLLDEVLDERMTTESFVCQMKTISEVIAENGVERIDLLKVDVQKSELEVLLGIDDGDWPKIEQVVLEVHDVDDRLGRIVSLLEAKGFRVVVRQEAMLKETALFDLYCVRPGRGRRAGGGREACDRAEGWTSPESFVEDARAHLKAHLPEHMIPSAFVLLERMPLTPNGKVDRRALPEPAEAGPEDGKTFVAPGNETEELLAGIWGQVLGLGRVGVNSNFFELGGDSILSIQIVARANQAGLRLTPKQLFRHQTVAELAAAVEEAAAADGGVNAHAAAEQGLLTGPAPLTPIQHYFFELPLTDRHHFNQSLMLDVRRPLRADLLQRVVTALVEHHDALRLRFEQTGAGWVQGYGDRESAGEILVRVVEVGDLDGDDAGRRRRVEAVADEAQRGMRLDGGGLFRVVLFEAGAEQRLLLVAHHLVVDGVSWRVIAEDLARGLEQAERGEAIEFGEKTTSYRAWAERLEEYGRGAEALGELDYWLGVEKSGRWKIPVDYPEGRNTVESARTVSASLDAEETRVLLQETPEAYRTQINDVLLTALAEAVGRWSGRQQVLVEMEGHGREELWEDVDLSRTVGWFTTLFPVLLETGVGADGGGGGALLQSVKERLRRVPNRGIGYGLLRYLCRDEEVSRCMRALPRPELRFNYLGQLDHVLPPDSRFGLSEEPAGAARDGEQTRGYLLDFGSAVSGGRLQLSLTYSENVHRRATAEALTRDLMGALRALIAHCQSPETGGLSPSDFPLAKLSQQQLDLIMSKAGRGAGAREG